MGRKCSAYGCKSGYSSNKEDNSKHRINFHKFSLNNKQLCDAWICQISRLNFQPTEHSSLCSLHFIEDDFGTESLDSNVTKKRKNVGGTYCIETTISEGKRWAKNIF